MNEQKNEKSHLFYNRLGGKERRNGGMLRADRRLTGYNQDLRL